MNCKGKNALKVYIWLLLSFDLYRSCTSLVSIKRHITTRSVLYLTTTSQHSPARQTSVLQWAQRDPLIKCHL